MRADYQEHKNVVNINIFRICYFFTLFLFSFQLTLTAQESRIMPVDLRPYFLQRLLPALNDTLKKDKFVFFGKKIWE